MSEWSYLSMGDWVNTRAKVAEAAGLVCKNCGGAIRKAHNGYYHIRTFVSWCQNSPATYAELKEGTE